MGKWVFMVMEIYNFNLAILPSYITVCCSKNPHPQNTKHKSTLRTPGSPGSSLPCCCHFTPLLRVAVSLTLSHTGQHATWLVSLSLSEEEEEKKRRWCIWHVSYHISYITSHISHLTSHISHLTSPISHLTSHTSHLPSHIT